MPDITIVRGDTLKLTIDDVPERWREQVRKELEAE